MATPRIVRSFTKGSDSYVVVWVGIGEYEIWRNKKLLFKELTMDQLIDRMALIIEEENNEEQPGANF